MAKMGRQMSEHNKANRTFQTAKGRESLIGALKEAPEQCTSGKRRLLRLNGGAKYSVHRKPKGRKNAIKRLPSKRTEELKAEKFGCSLRKPCRKRRKERREQPRSRENMIKQEKRGNGVVSTNTGREEGKKCTRTPWRYVRKKTWPGRGAAQYHVPEAQVRKKRKKTAKQNSIKGRERRRGRRIHGTRSEGATTMADITTAEEGTRAVRIRRVAAINSLKSRTKKRILTVGKGAQRERRLAAGGEKDMCRPKKL